MGSAGSLTNASAQISCHRILPGGRKVLVDIWGPSWRVFDCMREQLFDDVGVPPAEAAENYGRQRASQPKVTARFKLTGLRGSRGDSVPQALRLPSPEILSELQVTGILCKAWRSLHDFTQALAQLSGHLLLVRNHGIQQQ